MPDKELFKPLKTKRLLLRCVAPRDAVSITRIITPEISRWLAHWPSPFALDMAVERIGKFRTCISEGNGLIFTATTKDSDEMIGMIFISRSDKEPRRGRFGYWLGEEYHGNGYMKELAPVALKAAFEMLDLDVIDAASQPTNIASIKVLLGCGMKQVGEEIIYATARNCEELCYSYELKCTIKSRV